MGLVDILRDPSSESISSKKIFKNAQAGESQMVSKLSLTYGELVLESLGNLVRNCIIPITAKFSQYLPLSIPDFKHPGGSLNLTDLGEIDLFYQDCSFPN